MIYKHSVEYVINLHIMTCGVEFQTTALRSNIRIEK